MAMLAEWKESVAGIIKCGDAETKLMAERDAVAEKAKTDESAKKRYMTVLREIERVKEAKLAYETARDNAISSLGFDPMRLGK